MSSVSGLSQVSHPRKTSGVELPTISQRTSLLALMLWVLACRTLREGDYRGGIIVVNFLGEEV